MTGAIEEARPSGAERVRLAGAPAVGHASRVSCVAFGLPALLGAQRSGCRPASNRPRVRTARVLAHYGVEFVDHPGGVGHVALHVSTEKPDDNEVIDALTGDGDVIEVVEQQGASRTS